MTVSRIEKPVELAISTEKVCFIILKAREFDIKVEPVEEDPVSNPTDDAESGVLEGYADNPTLAELKEAIDDLNDDEVVDLIALAWVGRGDFARAEWGAARRLARERHRPKSSDYLIGMPALGDYLEEGLDTLGHSCEDFE
jgi:uncharacterized protein DUF3775